MNGREVLQAVDNWAVIFRLVTPALLGVLVWVNTVGNASRDRALERIDERLAKLSNDFYHELGGIKDRLGRIEGRNVILNGLQAQ